MVIRTAAVAGTAAAAWLLRGHLWTRRVEPEPPRPEPAPEPPTAPELRTTTGLPRALEITTAVIAPTTLITALMFYFGWSHAYFFCIYFGVNSTTLDFSTQDYLMRSVDGFFVPLTFAAIFALLAIWVTGRLGRTGKTHHSGRLRLTALLLFLLGLGATGLGLLRILGIEVIAAPYVPALLLALGAVLLLAGSRLTASLSPGTGHQASGTRAVVEWIATFVLISIALFWVVTDWSANVGTSRAQAAAAALGSQPAVTVYSAKGLGLRTAEVPELRCPDAESAYPYRYSGLVLILESGNQYLLVPASWHAGEAAIVLPRSDSTRLEYVATPGATPAPPSCR